jgi:hypothetical protein
MQKGVSNLRMSIEVKKKSAADGESFWLRTVSTKLPVLFLRHDRCAFVKEEFSCDSIHWVSLPEILVLASRLRTVSEGTEADTNGAGLLG